MKFDEIQFTLKDGRSAILRSPTENDAELALEYFKKVTSETDFLLYSKEETENITIDDERKILNQKLNDKNSAMISCFIEGKFAGNCDICFDTKIKTRHRVQVGIAILQEYWNLGIGSKMFEAMESMARQNKNVTQMELVVFEGNERAQHLYEKCGFKIVSVHPNAIKLLDKKLYNEYLMIKKLR